MPIDLLEFIGLVITGFTSCAEFGSYAFVHPVIRRLPREHHVSVEKGLLKTFGRVMPVLMTLCVVLSFAYAMQLRAARLAYWLRGTDYGGKVADASAGQVRATRVIGT